MGGLLASMVWVPSCVVIIAYGFPVALGSSAGYIFVFVAIYLAVLGGIIVIVLSCVEVCGRATDWAYVISDKRFAVHVGSARYRKTKLAYSLRHGPRDEPKKSVDLFQHVCDNQVQHGRHCDACRCYPEVERGCASAESSLAVSRWRRCGRRVRAAATALQGGGSACAASTGGGAFFPR